DLMERPLATTPQLELKKVSKSYGTTQALVSIDLPLRSAAVHGLVGENGAGKSTLVKILSGAVAPDGGRIELGGEAVQLGSPSVARGLGISTAFQELTLIPDLTVAENLLLQSGGRWAHGQGERIRRGSTMAARWGVSSLDMRAKISSLSLRERQIIEILCAVDRPHNVLILDEPTSSLLPDDTKWLRSVVKSCVSRVKQNQIKICENGTIEDMKNGCNAFSSPRISAGFMADWYDPKWTPNISLDEVATGQPQA
ncbi:MAG TPA: ATP-binding cassette domain-containing protein, partial [Propionibacteriaceae bacterium]|nr:ATP-binding cassette domain-containing protein [Propionibacteriaceae bacterium]